MRARTSAAQARFAVGLLIAAAACGGESKAPVTAHDAGAGDAGVDAGELDAGERGDDHDAGAVIALPTRDLEPHCILKGTPSDQLPRVELDPVAGVSFEGAAAIVGRSAEPEALYVGLRRGVIARVEPDAAEPSSATLVDLSSLISGEGAALLSIAFHPDYDENGLVFAHYVTGVPLRSIVSSFRVDPQTGQAPASSERRVLSIVHPGQGRSGGALLFDGDGMLLVGLGDGGDAEPTAVRDPRLGAILRLSVTTDDTPGYSIPEDNPFAGPDEDDGAPEALAYGFADPVACQIDEADGQLWCADRGRSWSELDAVEPGRDHGWPAVENVVCTDTQQLCLDSGAVNPAVGYLHVEGACGALGAVPVTSPSELQGAVIYADACTGSMRGLGVRAAALGKRSAIGGTDAAIEALGRDGRGALVLVDGRGALMRARVAQDELPGTFPERLSETGCFQGERLSRPAPDLIPFDVRSPLWSDGTHKRRFFVIPSGAHIATSDDGPWQFPLGSIIVKEFALPFDDGDPASVRPIETRFMIRRAAGWEFHSFRWNDQGTDAVRVHDEETIEYQVIRGGRPHTQKYLYPSSETCPACHSASPGRVLGPRTEQLNFDVAYEGGTRNQLAALAALDVFDRVPGEASSTPFDALPRLPDPRDQTGELEPRVRSYLHSNCAHCHQPGGYSSPDLKMDLRFSRTLAETNICDREPQFWSGAPKLIAPGDPERSALWVRTRASGIDRMPPVATSEVDPLGTVLLTRWIQQLEACPPSAED